MPSNYQEIADEHRLGYGAFDHHLEGYEDFYPDDTHFIYELLQNAQDAIATDPKNVSKRRFLEVILRHDEFVALNDGLPFAEKHVRAICSIRQSTKDLGQIGTHGIGFKAVGKFTAAPEIYSGDERFRIHRRVEPQLVEEIPLECREFVESGYTVFRLPFKESLPDEDIDRLGERLSNVHKWALLFLHDLCIVEWKDERRGIQGSYSRHGDPHPTIPDATIVRVSSVVHGEEHEIDTFLCISMRKQPPQAVIDKLCQQAKSEKERSSILASSQIAQPIEIAFALQDDVLVPVEGSVLFAFLPTRKETHLRFLIQAHYKTTFARDDIRDLENSGWNRWLVEETAAFFPKALCHLKTAGLWTPRAFYILPVPSDHIPDSEGKANIIQPMLRATLKALAEFELIPTAEIGCYALPTQVFHPHAKALRRLLMGADLSELTGVEGATWIHPDLTWDNRVGEILRAVGVKEVTGTQFVGWLKTKDAAWFEARDDLWLHELYIYLASPTLKSERQQIKEMSIARQEDGTHVCASTTWVFFQPEDDQQRQTIAPILGHLPAFKMSLLDGNERETIKVFLTDIGVEPLKLVRLIGKWFLPKYKDGEPFTLEENRGHVRFLVDTLDNLTESEMKELREEIKKIPFLVARKGVNRSVAGYAKPMEVYLPAAFTQLNDLDTYFGSDSPCWLVDDFYLEPSDDRKRWLDAMRKFGVSTLPIRRYQPQDPLSPEEKQKLRAGNGYSGDVETKDIVMDGLTEALTRIKEGRNDAHATAVALWRLLAQMVPQDEISRRGFFYGTYTWKYNRSQPSKPFPATFYKQLTQNAWVPSEGGDYYKPQDPILFAPDRDTKRILGERVRYLHADLDVTEQSSKTRILAEALGIRLTADIPTVLGQLQAMSGGPADITEVARLYEFLLRRGMTGRQSLFAESALIYTPEPPRWWKSGDVFWADEHVVFGSDRGYLEPIYPDLKPFFVALVNVTPNAGFSDYARAILELASQGAITSDTPRRLRILCLKLWAQSSVGTNAQEQASQQVLWQDLMNACCWLGMAEGKWEWHRRTELIMNDHDFLAELFTPHLPFWKYVGLDGLIHFVEMTPVSQASLTFTPQGEWQERADWSERVHGLKEHLACFLASPRLVPDPPDPAILNLLDTVSVIVVEQGDMTYELHGTCVIDPQPPQSYLENEEGQSTLWITQEAIEREYPLVIGEALEAHWDIKLLAAFVSELLGSDNRDRVLTRWQKKGLRYEPPASPPDGSEQEGEERPDADDGQSAHDSESSSPNGNDESEGLGNEGDDANGTNKGGADAKTNGARDNRDWPRSGHGGGGHGGSGGGPEGEVHKGLKRKIRTDPSLMASGLQVVDEEYDIASGHAGSKVDLLLKDAENKPVVVEVKPHIRPDEYSVVWQAIRYKHLVAVEWQCDCDVVRCFLVAPDIPQEIKLKCNIMGIEFREVTP